MKIGTKSVLYGYHAFWLHWLFVARAWYQLHGWRRVAIEYTELKQLDGGPVVRLKRKRYTSLTDPRLWLAFFLHDLGYFGKPNMDGAEGEQHPLWAGLVMQRLFGSPWGEFCWYHSRFFARRDKRDPSLLCAPDKLAIALYPRWLFLALVRATGEIQEYMAQSKDGASAETQDQVRWATDVQRFAYEYAMKMRAGGPDTVTGGPNEYNVRRVATDSGVWQ